MLTNSLSDIPFFLVILTASSEVRLSCILFVISLVKKVVPLILLAGAIVWLNITVTASP